MSNPPKSKPKRRSQEDIMANAFLKNTFKPVKKSMMTAYLLDVMSVLVLVGQTWILVRIFERWFDAFTSQSMSDDGYFLMDLGALFVCLCVRAGLGYGRDYLLSEAGLTVATNVKKALLDKLGQLGLARRYFGSDGSLASKMVDEPVHLVGYARFEVQKMTAVTTPLILAGCISFYSVTSAMILLLTAPLVPIFMAFIGIATTRKSREQMDALAQLGGRFLDWIRGMNTLSRLGAVDVAVSDIDKSSETYRQKTMSVLKIAFLNSAVLEFLSALSIALVAVYLGFGLLGLLPWANGQILTSYRVALFILLLVPEFYAPLRRLGAEYHVKGQAMACAKAVAPMLNFKHKKHTGQAHTLSHAPSFALKNVTAFGDDGRVRLSPLTAEFEAGQKTAVMGESGAGKSTLLQILLGFGDYEGDVVLTDGDKKVAYQETDLGHLRQQFGYLSQSLALLPMSIADNLRLAKPHASDDELKQVLQWVGMWEVVNALPQGMHTMLGERGRGLSGGQGQRLAIAQLLLQDAKVWLLDEPTEHLDAKTAWQIKELLWQLGADKTVIWVTHDEDFGGFEFDNIHRLGQQKG
ncbi:MAG: thiol reductant ABC exporter subunit CydD [Moraxella sp.]|uniref:thiol reductant ABC exporter subunit CydD n=1 Tax=Moraxella sp. TaxID=479 RepID=UPI0026DCFDCA|nr:thiol reductant ABC exporter subunit CydD [Moraxella sp.]MDO4450124.1 thiol reductant ABC exporter subunit CydD [Moraxella sp.]